MKMSITNDIGLGLMRLMWVGALAALIVFGLYACNFGPGQWFRLSGDPGDWGGLGDYVGGLLNPLFSFLAFIGVIITVILQSRQLDLVREQANFEEIQRVLSNISSRIDGLLALAPTTSTEQHKPESALKSMFEIISALGTWALNNPRPSPDVAGYGRWVVIDENMGRQRQAVHGELTTIGLELEALAWTLGRYAAAGGSEMVVDFYKYRYCPILTWMDAIGLLEDSNQIQEVFKPKEMRRFMVADPDI